MTTAKTHEQMVVYLISQEKTIRYARSQILEGDYINGKSILSSTMSQLGQQSLEGHNDQCHTTCTRLIAEIRKTLELLRE